MRQIWSRKGVTIRRIRPVRSLEHKKSSMAEKPLARNAGSKT
jgi:hypothetical protein